MGFDEFGNEVAVVVRGGAFGGISEDVLMLELAFAHLDTLTYARLKDSGVVLVAEVVGSLTSQSGALVGHDNEQAPHIEVGIEFALDILVGFDHAANAIYDFIGASVDPTNDEPHAYLVGFFADAIEEALKR